MNELQGNTNGGGGNYEEPGSPDATPAGPPPGDWDGALEELISTETVTV